MALGTRTKFQLEILTINVISSSVYFREIILESSWNVSETTPWSQFRAFGDLNVSDHIVQILYRVSVGEQVIGKYKLKLMSS